MGQVEFEEEKLESFLPRQMQADQENISNPLTRFLVKNHIAKNKKEAAIILFMVSCFFFLVSILIILGAFDLLPKARNKTNTIKTVPYNVWEKLPQRLQSIVRPGPKP